MIPLEALPTPWPAHHLRPRLLLRVSAVRTLPALAAYARGWLDWVNPLAYTPDPLATLSDGTSSDATVYGNTPRNCIIGPPQKNVDFTLGKTFRLGERQELRFRTDFFNLFNHPSFALPAATSVSPIVGSTGGGSAPITSTVGTPRLIQFSLKYSF